MRRRVGYSILLLGFFLVGVDVQAGGEYSNLSVEKTVDKHQPIPGEPVEFTIEVLNRGDYLAPDLHVQDKLQTPLVLPEGRGAFTDKGYYDPETGDWDVGDLDVGESAVLVVPAILEGEDLAECIVNTAEMDHPQDTSSYNNRSSMAVRGAPGRYCADVRAGFSVTPGESPDFIHTGPSCDSERPYSGSASVFNRGPDIARGVEISLHQEPVIGPNLRFNDAECTVNLTGVCTVEELAVGEELRLEFVSDPFLNKTVRDQRFSVEAITASNDYDTVNNSPGLDITVSAFSSCDGGVDYGLPEVGLPGVGGGGSGCFIATAAYGSYLHPRVNVLREFRDEVLVHSWLGREFVQRYYQYSPPVAQHIAGSEYLRAVVRVLLLPVVLVVAYPWFLILIPVLALLAAVGWNLFGRTKVG